jgi:diguanylate cyclase (GGDEF)-like protein/PAS domain S-box-containing protein
MGAISLWSLLYAVQAIIVDPVWKQFFDNLTYLGILAVPAAWMAFSLRYSGRGQWLYQRRVMLLAIEPALVMAAVMTNPEHWLFYTSAKMETIGGFVYLHLEHGPLFWVHSIYSYSLLLIASFHLLRTLSKSVAIYRRQVVAVMTGVMIPWALNAVYLLGGAPIPGLDPTPLAFTLTGVALILGVYRFGLLDLTPLARSTMIEVMSDGMLVLNDKNRIVDINPAACQFFGCTSSEAIGHKAEEFFSRWPDLVERYRGRADVHEPVTREINNELRTFDLQITPLKYEHGQVVGRLFLIRDITEDQRTRSALRESEERYRLLVETSPDAILMVDIKGSLLLWNKAATRLHELPEDADLSGMCVFDFVAPEDHERVREFSRLVRASGTLRLWEYRGVTISGREFPGEVSLSNFTDAEGNPKGFIAVLRDITSRKIADEEIRRAAESERRQRELADVLREIGACLSETLDFNTILDQLLEQVARVVPYDSANITMVHGNQAVITRSRGYQNFGKETAEAVDHYAFDLEKTESFRWMIEHKQPLVIPDVRKYPGWIFLPHTDHIRSVVKAPIIARGEVIAFFSLDKCEPNFYNLEHVETLAALSAQAGLALQNAILFEEATELLRREQQLNEILYKIGSSLDLSVVLDDILRLGCELLNADGSLLGMVEKDGQSVTVSHAYNFPAGAFEETLEKGEGITWEVIRSGAPILLEQYSSHPNARKKLVDHGVRSMLMAPVRVGDQVIGVLGFYLRRSEHVFTTRDIPLAEAIGREAGVAIDNARLFESAKKRAEEAETLREASNAVTSALELEKVLDQIMTNLDKVVPYDSCAIFLQEGDSLRIVAARGFPDPQKLLGHTFPTDAPLTSEGFQTGKVIIIPDAQRDERFLGWGDSSHVRGWMGVPLFARGKVTGFLTIDSVKSNAYDETDAQLAQAFANQAAIAIENARLFEKIQHLAITDPLTELFNRRQFFELARREFYRSRRYNDEMGLIMLDVDDLKLVNDTYGHQAGDQLIQFIGEQCRSQLRQADIPARYAGDEFIIALPGTNLEGSLQVARRIKERIAAGFTIDSQTVLPVSVSIGVSDLDETCFSLETLIARADKALYTAKAAGKNRIGGCNGGEFSVYD